MNKSVSPLTAPLTPEEFQEIIGVSHENMERLKIFIALLEKWQKRINLVAQSSLKDIWRRHVLDSAQLLPLIPKQTQTIMDMGSGGGFPGIVLAVLGDFQVHLVESDGKKSIFLNEANRLINGGAVIHNDRIENLQYFGVDVVTARACTSLTGLLDYALPFIGDGGQCLFLKGRKAEEELTQSEKKWNMSVDKTQSISDSSGVILTLKKISRNYKSGD